MIEQGAGKRIVYMGTPDFAVPALVALHNSRHDVVGVLTNPDRPAGRGKTIHQSPVKKAALDFGIPLYQPQKIRKNTEAYKTISDWKPDICVVAAYGQILPQKVLDIPPLGSINIHASLLPKYRGAAPINWCIVRGETETGITTMMMEKGLDTGPMLQQISIPIPRDAIAQEIHDDLSLLGAGMILPTIEELISGTLVPQIQDHDSSSYAPMMSKADGKILWTKTNLEVHNLIRGMNPWPGAYATFRDQNIKIHKSEISLRKLPPGRLEVYENALYVGCKEGSVKILEIQPQNKKKMQARDFINGRLSNTKNEDYFL